MFWTLTMVIGILAAGLIAWPLLKERAAVRNYGLAVVLAFPIAAILLYQQVGTPEGIGVSGTPRVQQEQQLQHPATGDAQFADLVRGLEQRLQENPADLEGWVLLGRSYKTVQQYDAAEAALVRAAQLAPDDPLVIVELAEARLFASSDPVIGDEVKAMLERALTLDPDQQKGLWLLGIAASQDGNDALAVELWERLVAQMEPGSGIAISVQEQIDQARMRLGEAAPPQPEGAAWAGIEVEVLAGESLPELPPTAVLFVIARNPAMPGPPLGVLRIANPTFPSVSLMSDNDSMMAEMPLSAAGEVELTARLSISGNVIAQPGDLQSPPVKINVAAPEPVQLVLSES
jgi:cytochrome c-type biogenesis protein CcmH